MDVGPGANGEDVHDNFRRKHTTAFEYPGTDHVYISPKASSFWEPVCEWIYHVPNCYILHCGGLEKEVSAFRSSDPLDVISDSDEKDGPPLSPEGEKMLSSLVSHGPDINAEEDDEESSIES